MIMLLNIFDEYRKNLLNNCASAYVMIKELKERFYRNRPIPTIMIRSLLQLKSSKNFL